jgi:hypothetical protein
LLKPLAIFFLGRAVEAGQRQFVFGIGSKLGVRWLGSRAAISLIQPRKASFL